MTRKERPAAGGSRVGLEALLQLRHLGARAKADRVEHRVARLHARHGLLARREAVAIVAVGEDHDALAAPVAADQIQRSDRGVVEGGAAPRRQQLHGGFARLSIPFALGNDEHRVVEPDERHGIVAAKLRQELLDCGLHLRQRTLHAPADVDREDQIQRSVLAHHAGNRLRHAVLVDLEVLLLQAAHELASVGHDDRHQHGIGADLLRVAEILRADVVHEPAAVGQRRDHPNVMTANDTARVPGADERRVLRRAREPAVDEEGDRSAVDRRIDRRLETRRAARNRVRLRRFDLELRLLIGDAEASTTGPSLRRQGTRALSSPRPFLVDGLRAVSRDERPAGGQQRKV